MVFTKVPDADLLREGLRSLSFYLNKDSIMVYGWTIKWIFLCGRAACPV